MFGKSRVNLLFIFTALFYQVLETHITCIAENEIIQMWICRVFVVVLHLHDPHELQESCLPCEILGGVK